MLRLVDSLDFTLIANLGPLDRSINSSFVKEWVKSVTLGLSGLLERKVTSSIFSYPFCDNYKIY